MHRYRDGTDADRGGRGGKAPYFHRSWINIPFGTDETELRHRVERSYDLIRASLTKKAQAALPARD